MTALMTAMITPTVRASTAPVGRVRLSLGQRGILGETGHAAEFGTITPHAFAAVDGPAELILVFNRDGQRAHVHRDNDDHPTM
jgi:hypothetical protein